MLDQQVTIANEIIPYMVLAVSLNLVMGYAGQPTMAQAAFGGVGGYFAALLSADAGLPFLAVIVIALVAGGVAAFAVALPVSRLGPELFVLVTFGVVEIVQSLIIAVGPLGGQSGIANIQVISIFGVSFLAPWRTFGLFIVIGILVVLACWRLGESSLGAVLRALRDDEGAAQGVGRFTSTIKLQIFTISGALAGLAGALLVYDLGVVGPGMFSAQETIYLIAMVVIGGSGNIWGSALGAIFVIALPKILESVVNLSPGDASLVQLVLFGVALVVIVMVRPGGLVKERRRQWGVLAKRLLSGDAAGPGLDLPSRALAAATADAGAVGVSLSGALEAGPARRSPQALAAAGAATALALGGDAPVATGSSVGDSPTGSGSLLQQHSGAIAVDVRGLTKSFGGLRAVDGVSLQLRAADLTVLIGPNGAGKSTLFGLFTGAMIPDAGRVELFGENVIGLPPHRVAAKGMVRSFQDVRLFSRLSVIENVMVAAFRRSDERLLSQFIPWRIRRGRDGALRRSWQALDFVGMADRADANVTSLSYAERKLVAIARIIATGAKVLLLDEPTSGVDLEWVGRIATVIRQLPQRGYTVCVVEHNLDFVRQLDAGCYFMVAGKVRAYGELDALMADPEMRFEYFGTM